MKVFLAGGSGVIGRRLIPNLLEAGHLVVMTRSESGASQIRQASAVPVTSDVFDLGRLREAVTRVKWWSVSSAMGPQPPPPCKCP